MKYTTESFIEKSSLVHNNFYDYSKTVYKGCITKVIVTCLLHGDFEVTPNAHSTSKRTQGCSICGNIKNGEKKKLNTGSFISKASIKHNNKYFYTKSVYGKDQYEKVIVTCNTHGDFLISPNNHMNGKGCKQCANDKLSRERNHTTESFLKRLEDVLGNKYGTSKVVYGKNNVHKVILDCSIHGEFKITPANVLSGRTCPFCSKSGYKTNKPASLYILQHKDIIKVGITNNTPYLRCKSVSNSSGKEFRIIFEYKFDNGEIPLNIESILLKHLRATHKPVSEVFSGSTECFYNVNVSELLIKIAELSANQ